MNFLQFERFGKFDEQTYRNHFEKEFEFMEFKILIKKHCSEELAIAFDPRENIKQTIFEIYKVILPKSNLKIEDNNKAGFLHFEKYDYLFKYNKPTSIIDIYLPLNTNK